ncbi:MAG TPA: hypothetical protein VMV07_24695 [Streptosporangiaceae bacterium]|nr:hypothetical protein [Streptosporangiaceae bacterium]
MAVVTVRNTENAAGGLLTSEVSAASTVASSATVPMVAGAMLAVAVAAVLMWEAYHSWIKPAPIHFLTGYVPYAGVVFMTAGLERFLEPLSQVLLPNEPAKQAAAFSRSRAQATGADPAADRAAVASKAAEAANKQAEADQRRTLRTIVFWVIASVCGMGISGGFGFFLLQSVSATPVNSFLDLAITGLTIGGGTKPLHDLITTVQARATGSP